MKYLSIITRCKGEMLPDADASQLNGIPNESNIVGVGYGVKISGDNIVDDLALRVYVRSKLPKSQVSQNEQVPSKINGKS